jgi:DnaA-homolog protein
VKPEQLTFELIPPEAPSFANFLGGANQELVEALTRAARGSLPETSIVAWGGPGTGKSHLLQATVHAARQAGRCGRYCATPADAPAEPPETGALLAVDAVDTADDAAQGRLFTLYNALAASDGQLVAATTAPPARLPLRPDLRTRLLHGLVYEAVALADMAKPAALARYAAARGFVLEPAVIDYLLSHYRRDMPSLLAMLASVDRYSLATRRPVTLPLVRTLLAERASPHG